MRLLGGGRELARWLYLQLGGVYFRIVAVGGPVAIVFLAIWPLSTVTVVLVVAALGPVFGGARRRWGLKKASRDVEADVLSPADGAAEDGAPRLDTGRLARTPGDHRHRAAGCRLGLSGRRYRDEAAENEGRDEGKAGREAGGHDGSFPGCRRGGPSSAGR